MEQRRRCSYHRSLELSSVFSVASLGCRGTWPIELVAKLGLRPPCFFLRRHRRGTLCYHLLQNRSRERGCCPGHHSFRCTIYHLGDDCQQQCSHSYGLPRGRWRWPSENMPSKLDEMLHFQSNSSPAGVYLPGVVRVFETSVSYVHHP